MSEQFCPGSGATLVFAANGVSQNFSLPPGNGLKLRFQNAGPGIAYAELTSNANSAAVVPNANTPGGFPIFANQPALQVQMTAVDTNVALISASTSSVSVTRGDII